VRQSWIFYINYYPFGLEHKGYNENTLQEYNHKQYQGQEFTKELGLDIHEWKYRISDPAIGRFWQVDPLAEDYVYNSVYAFQENKMGMGVELEGLELSAQRSKDGKSITLTYRVNPVNNTKATDGTYMLSTENFNKLNKGAAEAYAQTMSGTTSDGTTVTAKMVFDKNATITLEYNGQIREDGSGDEILSRGQGKTKTIGDTQENLVQINVGAHTNLDENFMYVVDDNVVNEVGSTNSHEGVHVGGNYHGVDIKNNDALKKQVNEDRNNTMYQEGIYGGDKINKKQRQIIIDNVEKQQPK